MLFPKRHIGNVYMDTCSIMLDDFVNPGVVKWFNWFM